jgi:hypothetical protein
MSCLVEFDQEKQLAQWAEAGYSSLALPDVDEDGFEDCDDYDDEEWVNERSQLPNMQEHRVLNEDADDLDVQYVIGDATKHQSFKSAWFL